MKPTDKINPADYVAHRRPGKFEGEQPSTEYFYEQMLTGVGDTIYMGDFNESLRDVPGREECADLFKIESEEAEAFDLPCGQWFLLWEDNQGFVYGEVYPTREAAEKSFTSKI